MTGCPGAGKSTLAEWLVDALDPQGQWAVAVSLDGFHFANTTLARLGRSARKGAIDTFDAYGYLAFLRRIRTETEHTVYVPDFDRSLEEPIAGSTAVDPNVRLVVTEGNYLLSSADPWPQVRREIGEVWYLDIDDDLRRDRLVARHVRFGKTEAAARRWVEDVDEANARLIAATRDAADLVVDMMRMEPPAQGRAAYGQR
jgi:pantothenate kinase